MPVIKTGCWFTPLPEGHVRIGISRGVPRRMPEGYRVFRKLAPGEWFSSVSVDEYDRRYRGEVLARFDPRAIAAQLQQLAAGGVAVMLCYERADCGLWCHRAMAAKWLADALGIVVPEVGFEQLPQDQHPLMPAHLR
jgi:hypothetical protein